nr:LysM peptidoglycan-binding domain-containing protein [Cohnella sp. REN36]
MQALPQDDQVLLRGHLLLTGAYKSEEDPASVRQLEHWIPVEISLPQNRVERIEDLAIEIDNFDVDLLSTRTLNVTGVLALRGLQVASPQVPVWQEDGFTVVHQAPFAEPEPQQGAPSAAPYYQQQPGPVYHPPSYFGIDPTRQAAEPPRETAEAPIVWYDQQRVDSQLQVEAQARADAQARAEAEARAVAEAEAWAEAETRAAQARAEAEARARAEEEERARAEEEERARAEAEARARAEAEEEAYAYAQAEQVRLARLAAERERQAAYDALPDADEDSAASPAYAGYRERTADEVEQAIKDADAGLGDAPTVYEVEVPLEAPGVPSDAVATLAAEPPRDEKPEMKVALNGKSAESQAAGTASSFGVGLLSQLGDKGARRQAEQRAAEEEQGDGVEAKDADSSGDELEWTRLFLAKDPAQSFRKVRLCIVQREDTLDAIASRYNVQSRELQLYNRMSDAHVAEGQVIYIP